MGRPVTQKVTLEGVTLQPYEPTLHKPGSVSHAGGCGQGGTDTCHADPEFSVTTDPHVWSVSACTKHVYGALEQARTMLLLRGDDAA